MEKFSSTVCYMQTKIVMSLFALLSLLSFSAKAQNRNFGIIYSENIKGGSALFGNTLMNAVNDNGTLILLQ